MSNQITVIEEIKSVFLSMKYGFYFLSILLLLETIIYIYMKNRNEENIIQMSKVNENEENVIQMSKVNENEENVIQMSKVNENEENVNENEENVIQMVNENKENVIQVVKINESNLNERKSKLIGYKLELSNLLLNLHLIKSKYKFT